MLNELHLREIRKGLHLSNLGSVSRKSRELFGPEKPFVKVRPAYSVKLVFSYVVNGIQTKITAKFRASRRLRFEDTKRIMYQKYARKVLPFKHDHSTVRFSNILQSVSVLRRRAP